MRSSRTLRARRRSETSKRGSASAAEGGERHEKVAVHQGFTGENWDFTKENEDLTRENSDLTKETSDLTRENADFYK